MTPLPQSAASQPINLVGLATLVVASMVLLLSNISPLYIALFCMAAFAAPLMVLDTTLLKVHRRPSTGLDWAQASIGATAHRRIWTKLVGFFATLALLVAVHWTFPFYDIARMQLPIAAALMLLPIVVGLALPYFALVDRAMREPEDGYFYAGCFALGQFRRIDWPRLKDYALGWMVKGFFLPIMFHYLISCAEHLQTNTEWLSLDFFMVMRWLVEYAVLLELSIVCIGYSCTLRVFDSHIRTASPFLDAWLVTLICYEPFNQVIGGGLLDYDDGTYWYEWFKDMPALAVPWGIAILASFGIWIWATLSFGLRWSNLTHRGIITNGPYRYTKHPDYLAKNVFFWLMNVPFLSQVSGAVAFKMTVAMVCINLIYLGRAMTEERHLMTDPVYAAYARAIDERGLFRRFRWRAAASGVASL